MLILDLRDEKSKIIGMKKLIALSTVAMFAFCANASDWANFSRYAQDNASVKNAPKAVLIGDSITDGWAAGNPTFFSDNKFVGRGIGGQVSSQMLVRIRRDVFDLHPEYVVILAGINDIAKNNGDISLENVLGNIASMSELARMHNVKVILCSVLPAAEFTWNKSVMPAEEVKKLNAMIKDYAKKNGIEYLDYYTEMSDERGGLPKELAKDGVHPTPAGYAIMQKLLLNKLAQIEKKN